MAGDECSAGAFVVDAGGVPDRETPPFQTCDGGFEQRNEFRPELGVCTNGFPYCRTLCCPPESLFADLLVQHVEGAFFHVLGRLEVDGIGR